MMEWILIIYIYAGPWSKTDSVTLATVPMATERDCYIAAQNAEPLVKQTAKEIRTVCLRTKQ